MQPVKGKCPSRLLQVYVKRQGGTADMPAVVQACGSDSILMRSIQYFGSGRMNYFSLSCIM